MKRTLLAAATLLALGLPLAGTALASPGDNPIRRLQYVTPDGHLMEMQMDPAKAELFLKSARKLGPGTLILTMDGNVYMLQDAKMADGRMLSDALMH